MNPITVNCLGTQCGIERDAEALAGPLALFLDTSLLNPVLSAYTHLVRLLAATFIALSFPKAKLSTGLTHVDDRHQQTRCAIKKSLWLDKKCAYERPTAVGLRRTQIRIRKPGVSKPRASTHHKQGAVAVRRLRPALLRMIRHGVQQCRSPAVP